MRKIEKLFLSAGSMRCGTTWLYNMLRDHPSLYFTPQKELHFLYDYYAGRREHQSLEIPIWEREYVTQARPQGDYEKRIERLKYLFNWALIQLDHELTYDYYHRLFSLRGDEEYCCDMSNVTSALSEEQLRDMKSQFPVVKVIYLLRDPLDRLWSDFIYSTPSLGRGVEEDSWNKDLILQWWNNSGSLTSLSFKYSEALKKLMNVFDADFKAIFYEDLLESTEKTLKKIEAFLEIEPFNYKEEKIKKRVNTSGYTHKMWSMFEEVLGPIAREEIRELSNYIKPHKSWRNYEDYT